MRGLSNYVATALLLMITIAVVSAAGQQLVSAVEQSLLVLRSGADDIHDVLSTCISTVFTWSDSSYNYVALYNCGEEPVEILAVLDEEGDATDFDLACVAESCSLATCNYVRSSTLPPRVLCIVRSRSVITAIVLDNGVVLEVGGR